MSVKKKSAAAGLYLETPAKQVCVRNGRIENGRTENGRTVCSTADVKMASHSVSTFADRGGVHVAESSPVRFRDIRTKPIIKLIYLKLCLECAREFGNVEQEIARFEKEDKELVHLVAERMVGVIKEWNVVRTNLEDYRKQRWNLYEGNMNSEFTKVTYELFSETVNWGRIIVFIGFSVSFTQYLMEQDVRNPAESVMEWTRLVIEEDLAKYFISNGGWEAFADYLDSSLRSALRRRNRVPRSVQSQVLPNGQQEVMRNGEGSGNPEESGWAGALVAGAVALGAVGLFTLRQALS